MNDKDLLKAAEWLRHGWRDMIGKDASTMTKLLDRMTDGDEATSHKAADHIKKLLDRHPRSREKIGFVLDHLLHRGYQPVPGRPSPISAGTKMICPVSSKCGCKTLRQKGQRLYCDEHGVELLPITSSD